MSRIGFVCFALMCVGLCHANPDAGFPKSCEVHPDRTVTFRFIAKDADVVELRGSFDLDNTKMTKGDAGLWEITVGPLQPDIYSYTFRVDGTTTLDPHNRWVKGWRRSANLVLVPGTPAKSWQVQDVPHGTIHRHVIADSVASAHREVFVYTPPGYQKADHDYPVLFLLHGSGDDASAWTNVGRAHDIADNLIASKQMKPMVIVMPYGHTSIGDEDQDQQEDLDKDAWWQKHDELVDRSFFADVVPFANQNYRVKQQPQFRAVAGLSMGGGQALRYGLIHPEQFGWILAYSSGTPDKLSKIGSQYARMPESARRQMLWIACGRKDRLLERNELFCEWLAGKRVEFQWHLTKGGHSWPVWRGYLEQTLPLLFQVEGD